ncbi:MAG TPA: hypothetical protein VNA87_05580 [Actinomycetota bacterium]|nr:hypothetical protein [Actinomycetota bacterium]
MTNHELDPETYKEIWGEYPPDHSGTAQTANHRRSEGSPQVAEATNEGRPDREPLLAAIEPHLVAIQTRLGAVESRLEGLERELKEIGNRGI